MDRADEERVVRLDFGASLGKVQRTPQGGLRVPARLTRTGVFTYRRADGGVVREHRPADEVFHADSLATLEDAPVTVDHPKRLVDPGTYRQVAVGHVRNVRRDGDFVSADVVVNDGEAVRRIEAGELREVSCGYRCVTEASSGRTDGGETFDAVQRAIRYNHAAIGPKGWGRAGRDVSLRLDAGDAIQHFDDAPPAPKPEPRQDSMKTIRIDGVDYEVGSAAHLQAQAKFDAERDTKVREAEEKASKEAARADAAEKKVADLETKLKEATSPERLDAAAKARADLLDGARLVLGKDEKLDGVSDEELVTKSLAKLDIDVSGKDTIYARARFDAEVAVLRKEGDRTDARRSKATARTAAAPVPQPKPTPRADADDKLVPPWQRKFSDWGKAS